MRIICFDSHPEEVAFFASHLAGQDIVLDIKQPAEAAIGDPTAEAVTIFIESKVDGDFLRRFPALKFIATRSTGYDHIDIKACLERGIIVSNVPSYGEYTVAEFAMGLVLALSRKIYLGIDRLKETGDFSYEGLQGFDLYGQTMGVIGTGRIGKHLVKMAQGFNMKVVAYDPYPNEELAKSTGLTYLSLEDLLAVADVVSIHVPYLPATHHLINAERLALMKPSALLINASRGGLVETNALLVALREGKLGGAGLDVLEEEASFKEEYALLHGGHPDAAQLKILLEDHELLRMPNVVITPHMAFDTREGVERILKVTVDNILAFASGAPINAVSG